MKSLYHFGPFTLDPNKRALFRQGKPVALTPKAFDVLLYLAQNPNRVVSKEELLKGVWAGSFVEEGNLTQNVFLLRKVLAEETGDTGLIVTVPRVGYQFAAEVATGQVATISEIAPVHASAPNDVVLEGVQSTTHIVIEEEIEADSAEPPKALLSPPSSSKWRWYALALVLAVVAAAVAFRPMLPPPTVTRIRQLTQLGTLVNNTKLLTDGPRIYFRAWDGKDRALRYVSPEGGEVFSVDRAFPQIDVDDLSPSGAEFLVVNLADKRRRSKSGDNLPSVWRIAVPSGSPRPVGDLRAREVSWAPDGRTIACAIGSDIYLVDPDGTNARKLATLPGEPFYLLWSPDSQRLRFSVADPHRNTAILWQADLASHAVAPLLADTFTGVLPGGWTPDGRYFFYTASGDGTRNVWAIREKKELLHRVNPQPVQITAGPLTFYLPAPSKDGKSVFAVGEQLRGELTRYDASAHQFVPYAKGISADHVTFSHDGQWMVYVEFPSGVLVRSRRDGSERRQLAFSPMHALSPQWSPDGTQIAFQGSPRPGAHPKIYLISSSGGLPVLAAPEGRGPDRQTYPSWASDGSSILFSGSDEARSNRALYSLDLKSRQVSSLPGSERLYWGQISPDGQHVVALEDSTQKLILYDGATHNIRTLAELADYPRWSLDGQYIYFSTMYFTGPGKNGGVFRWKLATNTTETVMKYPDFLLTGLFGVSYGVTPDGEILTVRDRSTRDLYALDVELP